MPTDEVLERNKRRQLLITECLANGRSPSQIRTALIEAGFERISKDDIIKEAGAIIADPVKYRQLQVHKKAAAITDISNITSIARKNMEDIQSLINTVRGQAHEIEGGQNIKTIHALTQLYNSANQWWQNLAKLHGAIGNDVEVNLTQVNIGQINATNGKLLEIIQDMVRWMPDDKRETLYERLDTLDAEFEP